MPCTGSSGAWTSSYSEEHILLTNLSGEQRMNALCTVGSSDACSLLCQLGDTLLTNTSGGAGSSDAHPSPDHPVDPHPSPDHPVDPESSRLKKVTLL